MSETARPRLKVSREGIALIKGFEGFRPEAERRVDGRWVIGHGHTASARQAAVVGADEAELLLQYDLMPIVAALNDHVTAPLNQHQFDALASFALSIGVDRFQGSDVLAALNEGFAARAADALQGWPEDEASDARSRRRHAERAMFFADPAQPAAIGDLLAARHPSDTRPQVVAALKPARLASWSETGAFLVIGGLGLLACGASAVAFRVAFEEPLPIRETAVVAWTLGLIGVACVSVAAVRLYRLWGPRA